MKSTENFTLVLGQARSYPEEKHRRIRHPYITSKRGSVRVNHYHKDTFQYVHIAERSQMPGEPTEKGDLIVDEPLERHVFEALDDCTMLLLTWDPRGGDNYETDTLRLYAPLIVTKS